MKKEESKVIAQKLQKIPNGTLALKHCRAGGTGSTFFGEQFRATFMQVQTSPTETTYSFIGPVKKRLPGLFLFI